jgi:hypothetical protein
MKDKHCLMLASLHSCTAPVQKFEFCQTRQTLITIAHSNRALAASAVYLLILNRFGPHYRLIADCAVQPPSSSLSINFGTPSTVQQLMSDERSLKHKAERTQHQRAKKESKVDAEHKEQLSADTFLLPWVQAASAPPVALDGTAAAAADAADEEELAPVQHHQHGAAATWELVLVYVAAQYTPKEVRGVTAVAQDIARTACVCTDARVAAAAGWRTLATRCPALPALKGTSRSWQTIVNYPLHIRADELKAAAHGLKLVLKGTKAVLAQRLLKALRLTGPTTVPIAILAAARAECNSKAYVCSSADHLELYTTVQKLANLLDAAATAAMLARGNQVLFRRALQQGGYTSMYELTAALTKAQKAKVKQQRTAAAAAKAAKAQTHTPSLIAAEQL